MKKQRDFIRLLSGIAVFFLILAGQAGAVVITGADFITTNESGYYGLSAGFDMSDYVYGDTTFKLNVNGTEKTFDPYYVSGSTAFYWIDITDPIWGWGGVPGDYEGASVLYTVSDSTPETVMIGLAPNGLQMIQEMENLFVSSGGLNPTISWVDPGGAAFNAYKIRVYDSNGHVYSTTNLEYADLGGANGSFYFDPADRMIGPDFVEGFTFTPGVEYEIRVEAREFLDLADFTSGVGYYTLPDDPNWWAYGNRSRVRINFTASTVPAPSTIWLLGSALAGLCGYCRRKPYI